MSYIRKLFGGPRRLETDMRDTTHAERVVAHPPFDLLTDHGDGPSRRLRVDVGQTGFFAGREFRTFLELSIATGTTLVVRAIVPIDVILQGLELDVEDGHLRLGTFVGGTPSGTFSSALPVLPRNGMTERPAPVYSAVVSLASGGAHTGGVQLDVLRAKTANQSSQASSVGVVTGDERGIAPGTYYFRIENLGSGTALGVLRASWEERT